MRQQEEVEPIPYLKEKCNRLLSNRAICKNFATIIFQIYDWIYLDMRGHALNLKSAILDRMSKSDGDVWSVADFLDLGPRVAVDPALHRLVASGDIRRIARGLYDKPGINQLTGKPTYPDYRKVIDALSRRDRIRMVVDGITAANDLGLTDAVPARATVLTDARLQPIKLGNLTIKFQHAAPSRLYWAGHPAMRVVQALYWLRDLLPTDKDQIFKRLLRIFVDPIHGKAIQDDLQDGLSALPEWLQEIVRELLKRSKDAKPAPPPTTPPTPTTTHSSTTDRSRREELRP